MKRKAKERCTPFRRKFRRCSSRSFRRSNPKISMQKEEVKAVMAPSTEGKSAEIRPMMKIMKIMKIIAPTFFIFLLNFNDYNHMAFCDFDNRFV